MDSRPASPDWTFPLSRRAMTALLTLLAALGAVATSIYVPSLPDIAPSLNTSPALVQMTMTAFMLGFAVMQLIYGPLSDSKGRRPALLLGLSIFLLGNILCATAATIDQLIFGRIVQALGACVGPAIARAVVLDAFGTAGATTVMASVAAGISLAPAVGPTVGGFLHSAFSWHASFILLIILSMALLFTTWRFLPETNQQKSFHAFRLGSLYYNYKELLKNQTFMVYTGTISLSFGAMIAYVTGAPFLFIQNFHISPENFGLLTILNALGFMSGTLVTRKKAGVWTNRRLAFLGSAVAILGGAWLLIQAVANLLSVAGVLSGIFIFQLGLGIQLPASFAGSSTAAPHLAGAGAGLSGFCQMATAALLSSLVAVLNRADYVPLMTILFLATLFSLFTTLMVRQEGGVS